jgi:hypothetical protein
LTLLVDPIVNIGQARQAKEGSTSSTCKLIKIKAISSQDISSLLCQYLSSKVPRENEEANLKQRFKCGKKSLTMKMVTNTIQRASISSKASLNFIFITLYIALCSEDEDVIDLSKDIGEESRPNRKQTKGSEIVKYTWRDDGEEEEEEQEDDRSKKAKTGRKEQTTVSSKQRRKQPVKSNKRKSSKTTEASEAPQQKKQRTSKRAK